MRVAVTECDESRLKSRLAIADIAEPERPSSLGIIQQSRSTSTVMQMLSSAVRVKSTESLGLEPAHSTGTACTGQADRVSYYVEAGICVCYEGTSTMWKHIYAFIVRVQVHRYCQFCI